MPYIALVAALAVISVAGVVTWVRRAGSSARILDMPAGDLERLFVGDVMRKHVITSGGLARLEMLDWGVRVRGAFFSRWLVATWEATYEELAIAELVSTRYSRIAVWFRLRGEPGGGTAFLSSWHQDILTMMEKHDIPVNRSVTQISGPAELYGTPR